MNDDEEPCVKKIAGPFSVEVVSKGGVSPHLVLRCACGWATKPQQRDAALAHRCLVDRPCR